MKRAARITCAFSLALIFAACSDSAPTAGTGGTGPMSDAGTRIDRGTGPQVPDRGVPAGSRRLMIIGDSDVFALTGAEVNPPVAYEENRRPVASSRITFRLFDENGTPANASGIQGSVLNSSSALTNADGVAQI